MAYKTHGEIAYKIHQIMIYKTWLIKKQAKGDAEVIVVSTPTTVTQYYNSLL